MLLAVVVVLGGCESDLARRISNYERMNDTAAAKQLLVQTTRSEPENAEAHFLLGRLYMREGAYEKGLSALDASRAQSPRFAEQIRYVKQKYAREEFATGTKALEGGAHGAAEAAFQAVRVIQPDNVAPVKALGQVRVEAGRPEDARTAYREALEMAPEDIELLNNLSALAAEAGEYPAAIRYGRRALEQSSPQPRIRKRLAYAFVETEQWPEALRAFEALLQAAPSSTVRRDYAFLLFNREKYGQALPLLQQLAGGGDSVKVLRALGETYGALGRTEAAARTYRRVLQQRPDDLQALQRLVIAYERLGEEAAVKELRTRLQRVRTDEDE